MAFTGSQLGQGQLGELGLGTAGSTAPGPPTVSAGVIMGFACAGAVKIPRTGAVHVTMGAAAVGVSSNISADAHVLAGAAVIGRAAVPVSVVQSVSMGVSVTTRISYRAAASAGVVMGGGIFGVQARASVTVGASAVNRKGIALPLTARARMGASVVASNTMRAAVAAGVTVSAFMDAEVIDTGHQDLFTQPDTPDGHQDLFQEV